MYIFTGGFNFKGLTVLRLYKLFGVNGLIQWAELNILLLWGKNEHINLQKILLSLS
jgi:hypothetical protein